MFSRFFNSEDRTAEAYHLVSFCGVFVYLFLWVYVVIYKNQAFDGQAFGIGLGTVMVSSGLAAIGTGIQRKVQGDTSTATTNTTVTATTTTVEPAP